MADLGEYFGYRRIKAGVKDLFSRFVLPIHFINGFSKPPAWAKEDDTLEKIFYRYRLLSLGWFFVILPFFGLSEMMMVYYSRH